MPRLILLNGTSSSVTYTLSGDETLHVESVSATLDATGAAGNFSGDVAFFDPSGFLIARSRSSETLGIAPTWEITWAPSLPDTEELLNGFLTPVVTTGLANTIVPPSGSIVVSATDAGAIVTQARLWVDSVGDTTSDQGGDVIDVGRWAFVPGPGA